MGMVTIHQIGTIGSQALRILHGSMRAVQRLDGSGLSKKQILSICTHKEQHHLGAVRDRGAMVAKSCAIAEKARISWLKV